jgi:hypothetical protein
MMMAAILQYTYRESALRFRMISLQLIMPRPLGWKLRLSIFILLFFTTALLVTPPAQARENPVTAIALFDGPSGPAYVQIAGIMLNGKTELRVCDGVSKISKIVFDGLPRIQIAGATSLERANDGALLLTANAKTTCVVPSNLKFDKNAEFTPADAADQATLQGTMISSSLQGSDLPQVKRGLRLVFVTAADDELAQFLLAQRTNSIASWQDFLNRHGASTRAADGKNALAGLYEQSAESAFANYEKSATGDLTALKQAEEQSVLANQVVAGYLAASQLRARINKELDALLLPDAAKLQSFRKALAEQTAGYAQLAEARRHAEDLFSVNTEYAPVLNLRSEIAAEVRKLESTVQQAEGLAVGKDYDQALQVLGPYRAFAGEVPRINSIITSAYALHFLRGRQLAAAHDWEKSVAEFRRAAEINKSSQDAITELKEAELQWTAARDRQAAQRALAKSREFADNRDFIAAYETLAELPDGPRALVAGDLTSLQKEFIPAALRRSQKLQEIHMPIRGRADEDAMREAYDLLASAGTTGDPAIKLKLDLLSDKISAYYVDRAQRYLSRPMGSGVGIGWLLLNEAEHYKPNWGAVKDARAQYASAYQLRSRLSLGVLLRDQTSRRDSPGFADQLVDAIANGLESPGLSVKVVRQTKEGGDAVQPSFLLIGEILAHRVVKDTNLETLPSKYRAGTHDVKNEEWSKANDDYSSAQQALQSAQRALADAHGKKEAATANDAIAAAQKALEDARHKLDATEPTRPQPVIESYNYTKKNIDLTATVELAFHLSDANGNVIEPGVPVKNDNHKRFMVLENVKPEDTEGVKSQGTEPDEVQFLTEVEIQARDLLVKSVRDKVMALPAKVLEEARAKGQHNDADGAAEDYIVYLNATPNHSSAEREEAAKFLREHYNLEVTATSSGSGPAQALIVSH